MLALNEVDDVRPVLEFYGQFDDPIAAFREKQRQLLVIMLFRCLVTVFLRLYRVAQNKSDYSTEFTKIA